MPHPHRKMFSYWTWISTHANLVLFDLYMPQRKGHWWRRYFTG